MNADTTSGSATRLRVLGRVALGAVGALLASSGIAFAVQEVSRGRTDDVPPVEAPPAQTPPPVADANDEEVSEDAGIEGDEQAEIGQAEAEANRAAAEEFAEGIRSWTDCIADNAANTPREERGPHFDPKDGCEAPATTPSGQPFDPGAGGEPGAERGPDEGAGPAAGGPPEDVPGGPPAGTPEGPPEDVPGGPPAGTPEGPPEDAPAGGPPSED